MRKNFIFVFAHMLGCTFFCFKSQAIDLEIYNAKAIQCGEQVWRASYDAIGRHVSFGSTGDVLCAADRITMRLYRQMLDEFRTNDIKYIFGGLNGDDEEAALLIAEEVQRRKLGLIVDSRCSEACADYIFPGAVEKYVSQRGSVIWRGGRVGRFGDRDDTLARNRGRAFLMGLGVNPSLLEALPEGVMRDAEFLKAREAGEKPGWSWSQKSLREFFGVEGVTIVRDDQQERRWRSRQLDWRPLIVQ